MRHDEDYFNGRGNQKIYRQWWLPEGEVRASVLIVHGLAEHSGRYQMLVDHLLPQGFAIFSFDHFGHGKSDGLRCHADSMADFADNLQRMVLWVKQQQEGKPLFLLGHSMGGLITANYLLDHQGEVSGAILSAPAIMTSRQPSLGQKLRAALFKIISPRAAFAKLEAEGVSRNPDVVAAYEADPLVHRGAMSVGLALVLGGAMARLGKEAPAIVLPMLIVQGGADRMVAPEGASFLHDRISSRDKHLQVYPDAYHEVLNEPEGPQMLALISDWLMARSVSAP